MHAPSSLDNPSIIKLIHTPRKSPLNRLLPNLPNILTVPPDLHPRRLHLVPLPNLQLLRVLAHRLGPHAEPPLRPMLVAAPQSAVPVDVSQLSAHGGAIIREVEALRAGHGGGKEGIGVDIGFGGGVGACCG